VVAVSVPTASVPMGYVETPSGRFVSIKEPDPADITVGDIAHKLAQTNRWGGSAKYPYSVAQHAVFVSERLERMGHPRHIQLLGLHHDDPEAYLGDLPHPWKALVGDIYRLLTDAMENAIDAALGLPASRNPTVAAKTHDIIKSADHFALLVEARNLLPSGGRAWDYVQKFHDSAGVQRVVTPLYWQGEMRWDDARHLYLQRHEELTNGV
jgi:5'-deoxynucleotidase YfbR-like HD superfamily hydrolase